MGEKGLADSQGVALAFLRQEGILDNRAYRNTTGVDSRVATSELRDLVARELVTQTGTRRWARYQLSWRTTSAKGQSSRADRRPELLVALGNATLSRSELVTRTGLGDQTIRRWLKIMRDEGTVDVVGSSPKSKHVRYRRTYQNQLFHSDGLLPVNACPWTDR